MSERRTILITNVWLSTYTGSEVVVRDLALGLLRRGHRPIVYSPILGSIADEIGRCGVSVIEDLRLLGEAPDLIHAQHAIQSGEAMIRFPGVPSIFVCHGFAPRDEAPVHFPQIGAYVAVDTACRDRLVHREGIDPQRVLMLHNGVDLDRIPPRPEGLAPRPRRAAAFGKADSVQELRTACERLGIRFDVIGADSGNTAPERHLVEYDLVFASARSALEAVCCGCAVIVCDLRGFYGFATSQNFDFLRANNFGLRCLQDKITVERCVQEIGRYDPDDASAVAERARADADLNILLDKFEHLYDEVLTGARRPSFSATEHDKAIARFLHDNLPRLPRDMQWPSIAERESLRQEVDSLASRLVQQAGLQQEIDALASRLAEQAGLQQEIDALTGRLAQQAGLQQEIDALRQALDDARTRLSELEQSRLVKAARLLSRTVGRKALQSRFAEWRQIVRRKAPCK